MHPRLAAIISTVGSPFVLFPVIASYLTIQEIGVRQSMPAILALLAVFAVLGVFILLRMKRGAISNLDVSDRTQRTRNVYLPSLGLIGLVALYFWWTKQPFVLETLYVGGLLAVCFAINTVKKISLHTVVATYLSALLLFHHLGWGVAMFLAAALIAWSRVVLGRHTRTEVLLGWVVGSAFGLGHAWLF
ncbi:MAG: hypothetical protein JNJ57_09370 [Saprospiraceae bacterium]|nr:hypothetical protein [Saprospiraceae bacterium]